MTVEDLAKSGLNWSGPGYFDLPGPLRDVLEKARADLDAEQHERALGALGKLYRDEGPTGALSPAERAVVARALGIGYFFQAGLTLSRKLAQVEEQPDWLVDTVKNRLKQGLVGLATVAAAKTAEPGDAGVALECMACGESIGGEFLHVPIDDDTQAVVCLPCGQRSEAEHNVQLRPALLAAGEAIVLAQHLAPDEPTIQEYATTLRQQMAEIGQITLPSVEQCLGNQGLVRAEPRPPALAATSAAANTENPEIAISRTSAATSTAANGITSRTEVAGSAASDSLAAPNRGQPEARIAAIKAMSASGRTRPKELVQRLVRFMAEDQTAEVCAAAARALGELGEAAAPATEELVQARKDPWPEVRQAAREALAQVDPQRARRLHLLDLTKRLGLAAAVLLLVSGGLGGSCLYRAASSRGDMDAVRRLNGLGLMGPARAMEILLTKTLPRLSTHPGQAAEIEIPPGKARTAYIVEMRAELRKRLDDLDRDWRHKPPAGKAIAAAVARLGACAEDECLALRDDLEFLDPEWTRRSEAKNAVARLVARWTDETQQVPWSTLGPWASAVPRLGLAAEPLVPLLAAVAWQRRYGGADEGAAEKAEAALEELAKLGVAAAKHETDELAKARPSLAQVQAAIKLCDSAKTREQCVVKLAGFAEFGEVEQSKLAMVALRGLGPAAASALPAIERVASGKRPALVIPARETIAALRGTAKPEGRAPTSAKTEEPPKPVPAEKPQPPPEVPSARPPVVATPPRKPDETRTRSATATSLDTGAKPKSEPLPAPKPIVAAATPHDTGAKPKGEPSSPPKQPRARGSAHDTRRDSTMLPPFLSGSRPTDAKGSSRETGVKAKAEPPSAPKSGKGRAPKLNRTF